MEKVTQTSYLEINIILHDLFLYLCEHIFHLLKVPAVVPAAAALAVSASNTTQGKPRGLLVLSLSHGVKLL